MAKQQLLDSTARYGTASRLLHWSMGAILAWQFATAAAHLLFEDTGVERFLWGTHKVVGTLLILLIVIRALWSIYNRGHRPPSLNIMAQLGHLAMYALMLAVPLLALIRQYGSGRSFAPLGIPLMSGFEGDPIDWLTAPGNLLHSWLGWLLMILILGHIAMVFIHRRRPRDHDVLARMVGDRHG
ncbi:cytochrome B561 [Stutzerimonas stutzeri]|uniref:Cytochrome B561 n=1 Tax=Stutzerimonas stutzeri TaxID=316 RepID=W8QUX1_STUST|nr:cytochrome b [Stutzerimonas stutzeri]AHL74390.1 cytochrome B561 [Stutzerimonas stutzeri]MCQ4328917.1 cytochrome b [Stutzerimonas stutzeri]